MSKHKVIVLDPVSQEGIQALIDHDDFEVTRQEGLTEAQIIDIIHDFDAVIVRSQTTVTKRIIQHAKNLKMIARAGVGVDKDRKSTRLNSSHVSISYAVFCLKKKM